MSDKAFAVATVSFAVASIFGMLQALIAASDSNSRSGRFVRRGLFGGLGGAILLASIVNHRPVMEPREVLFWLLVAAMWYPTACTVMWLHRPRRGK